MESVTWQLPVAGCRRLVRQPPSPRPRVEPDAWNPESGQRPVVFAFSERQRHGDWGAVLAPAVCRDVRAPHPVAARHDHTRTSYDDDDDVLVRGRLTSNKYVRGTQDKVVCRSTRQR